MRVEKQMAGEFSEQQHDVGPVHVHIHKENWLRLIWSKGKWYIISSLFTKGISFLLIPVYTRFLTPTDYGILNSLNSVAQLLPIFISLYLDSAFGRFFHDKKTDLAELRRLFSTIFWFVVGWGAFVVFLSLATSPLWVPGLLKVSIWPYAFLAFIPPLFLQIGTLGVVFLRQNLESRQTTILEVSSTTVGLLVTLPLLFIGMGVVARLLGMLFQAFFLFGFYTAYFWRKGLLAFEFDRVTLRMCLAYSIPLIPNIAGGWISGLADRLIIAKYVDLSAVGLYSLASQVGMLLYVAQDAITQITGPVSISGLIHDRENTRGKMARLSTMMLGGMLLADLLLLYFSQELIRIVTVKAYQNAAAIVAVFGFAYVVSSQMRIFSDVLSYHKKTIFLSLSGIVSSLVSLALNLLLIPRLGYQVSSYVLVISTIVNLIAIFLWSRRYEKLPLTYGRSGLLLVLFGAAAAAYGLLFTESSLWKVFAKLGVISVVALTGFYVVRAQPRPKRST